MDELKFKKPATDQKKLVRKEKFPYEAGPNARGTIDCVIKPIPNPIILVINLKEYLFLKESSELLFFTSDMFCLRFPSGWSPKNSVNQEKINRLKRQKTTSGKTRNFNEQS